jgi:pyrroline-5-carboxylate reductase
MAEAMIGGLLRQKLAKPENLTAAGPREERLGELQKKYGVKTSTDNSSAASHADVVVLSIKPQRLSEVMKGLKGIRPEALVLSIIAGASIKKISTGLKHKSGAARYKYPQIAEGITVWTASKKSPKNSRRPPRPSSLG